MKFGQSLIMVLLAGIACLLVFLICGLSILRLKTEPSLQGHYLYSRGYKRLSDSDFSGCIQDMTRAIDTSDSADAIWVLDAYRLRARAKYSLADYCGAVADFDRFINCSGCKPPADLILRGLSKLNSNNVSGAFEDLDAAILISPCQGYYARAYAHSRLGSVGRAISDLKMSAGFERHNIATGLVGLFLKMDSISFNREANNLLLPLVIVDRQKVFLQAAAESKTVFSSPGGL